MDYNRFYFTELQPGMAIILDDWLTGIVNDVTIDSVYYFIRWNRNHEDAKVKVIHVDEYIKKGMLRQLTPLERVVYGI